MLLSHSSDYAIRVLSEIVRESGEMANGKVSHGQYIQGETLCDNAELPREFVAKILAVLVNAKILGSRKGPRGGFVLVKPAHEITLLSVIEAIDGKDQIDWCVVRSAQCDDRRQCRQHGLFQTLQHRMREYLSTTTLVDAAAGIRVSGATVARPSESSGQGDENGSLLRP